MIKFPIGTTFAQNINVADIAKWTKNVILEGGTATGKTHFILHILSKYAEEHDLSILFLCNRTALFNEIKSEIQLLGIRNVDVMSYQNVEDFLRKEQSMFMIHDYLVCDEFHHVTEIYNLYTDLSYKWIIEHPATKIFMSATCPNIFNSFVEDDIVPNDQRYYIPKDYSYVDEVKFFKSNDFIQSFIDDKLHSTDDKIIYFANSTKKAIQIYELFKEHASFYCSKHTKNELAEKYLEENKGVIKNQKFDSRLLVTTKALDVGITLKDKAIKHIVSDIFDTASLIQCLGRKRIIDKTDTCKFYLRNYTKRELNLFRKDEKLRPIELFKKDRDKYNKTYGIDRSFHSDYIYFDKKVNDYTYNRLAYIKLNRDNDDLDLMANKEWKTKEGDVIKGIGYKRFILNALGETITNVTDYDEELEQLKKSELEIYLDGIVGEVMLTKKDRLPLVEKINIRQNGKLLKSLNSLNAGMSENELNFYIKEFETSRIVDGKKKKYKSAWKIMRLVEN